MSRIAHAVDKMPQSQSCIQLVSARGLAVGSVGLAGRLILVVEDEPLTAVDLIKHCEDAGAMVSSSATVADALRLAERPGLAAAGT